MKGMLNSKIQFLSGGRLPSFNELVPDEKDNLPWDRRINVIKQNGAAFIKVDAAFVDYLATLNESLTRNNVEKAKILVKQILDGVGELQKI